MKIADTLLELTEQLRTNKEMRVGALLCLYQQIEYEYLEIHSAIRRDDYMQVQLCLENIKRLIGD